MAKEKTITLPELPADQFYCPMPRVVTETLGSGFGKWELTIDALTDAMIRGLFAYGVRQVGNDGAVNAEKAEGADKATDSAKQAAISKRVAAIVSGRYVFGHGGGARLDTYLIVLREMMSAALIRDGGEKKGEADKLARTDCETAYGLVCTAIAKAGGHDADQVFAVMWPRIQANAESEAKRRDAAADSADIHKGLADMITAAVLKEKHAAA